MFNAEKARELTKEANTLKLDEVIEGIKESAAEGFTTHLLYKDLTEQVIAELNQRGFKLKTQYPDGRKTKGWQYCISW